MRIAGEIKHKVSFLAEHPRLGHPVAGQSKYRELMLRALNASYVLQYEIYSDRVVILRVFHGRESRELDQE